MKMHTWFSVLNVSLLASMAFCKFSSSSDELSCVSVTGMLVVVGVGFPVVCSWSFLAAVPP